MQLYSMWSFTFDCGSAGKESTCNGGRPGFIPWVGKIPLEKERLPTPVFWPGEFHGQYRPWGGKESDMIEWLSLSFTWHHVCEIQSCFYIYKCSITFYFWIVFCVMDIPQCVYIFPNWWSFGLFPNFGCYKWWCFDNSHTRFFWDICFPSLG